MDKNLNIFLLVGMIAVLKWFILEFYMEQFREKAISIINSYVPGFDLALLATVWDLRLSYTIGV